MGLLNTLSKDSEGIIPKSLTYIFQTLTETTDEEEEAHLCVSMIQIYRDEIFD